MDIVEWLNSEEGAAWSEMRHSGNDSGGNPARYSHGLFASVKDDHECNPHDCRPYNAFKFIDEQIKREIDRYGMNGIADAA